MSELSESNEHEWIRLERQIELSKGFWLGFLFSSDMGLANKVRGRTSQLLQRQNQKILCVRPSEPSELQTILIQLVMDEAWADAGCIWLDVNRVDAPGLKIRPWFAAAEQFFLRLNESRDALRPHLKGFLMINAHPNTKVLVREAAPDLWSIRSIVAELEVLSVSGVVQSLLVDRFRRMANIRDLFVSPHHSNHEMLDHPLSEMFAPVSSSPDPNFAMAEVARRELMLEQMEASISSKRPDGLYAALGQAYLQAAQGYWTLSDFAQAKDAAEHAFSHLMPMDLHAGAEALFVLAKCEYAMRLVNDAASHISLALHNHQQSNRGQAPAHWYNYAGKIFFAKNEFSQAEAHFAVAVQSARKDIAGQSPTPANHILFWKLSVYLKDQGEAQICCGHITSAIQTFLEALEIDQTREEITLKSPQDHNRALLGLSFSFLRMGDVQRYAGDTIQALAAYEEAAAIDRRLAATADIRILRSLSVTLNRIGRLWRDAGEPATAMPLFEEAFQIRRRIIDIHGETTERLLYLLSALSKLALTAHDCGDEPRAKACLAEVEHLAKQLSYVSPYARKAAAYLAQTRAGLSADGYSPMAQAASKLTSD